jgi:Ca2+-transporting ATPase
MGLRGTQVAREAAAMVLEDDELGTIVAAVEEGRAIFANLRKFVLYLLSCNASEVLVVGIASLASAPLPILPLQILFLNLVTDVFPALALGAGEGDARLMQCPPRAAREEILGRREWRAIALHAVLITGAVLGAMAIASLGLDMDRGRSVSVSFLTLASAQLWHVFDMRERGTRVLHNEVTRNPWVWGALALCAALLLSATYSPGLRDVLDVHDPGWQGWMVVVGLGALPTLALQLGAVVAHRERSR